MKHAVPRLVRYGKVATHVGVALAKVATRWESWDSARRQAECRAWSRRALDIFGFSAVAAGHVPRTGDAAPLLVANHKSWLDIYLVMTHVDAVFVAKEEVRTWPAIGWLAGKLGTIFLDRTRKQSLVQTLQRMTEQLARGRAVMLFPEGTTTDGRTILPFNAALFDAAIRADRPVQPIAIRYLDAYGGPASEPAFIGDMTLIQSFRRLADCRGYIAEIAFLEPIPPAGRSRLELARLAETAIRRQLGLGDHGTAGLRVAA
jgi:1-acyl-sn-glycerol-3-phosphate acyltransferase